MKSSPRSPPLEKARSNKDPTQPKKEKKIESSKYSWEGELRVWEHPGGQEADWGRVRGGRQEGERGAPGRLGGGALQN